MRHFKPEHELAIYLVVASVTAALLAFSGMFDALPLDGAIAVPLLVGALLMTVLLCYSYLRRSHLYHHENFARQLAERELEKLSQAVEQSPAGVTIMTADWEIEYANPKFCESADYAREQLLGQRLLPLLGNKLPRAQQEEIVQTLSRGETWHGELTFQRRRGGTAFTDASLSPIVDRNGRLQHIMGLMEDISDRVAYREHLFRQANYDRLTTLPNRALAIDRLQQAINSAERHNRSITLLLVDLDRFKMINDTLGHQYGDDLLQEAAKRLQLCVRDEDTVARLGGDEFLIILVNQRSGSDATIVANKVIDEIDKPFFVDDRELNVTASVGVTVYPNDGGTSAELLRNAETAMHTAKQQGQNTYYFFTPEMNRVALERFNIETQLRHAVKRGELQLYYQPLIELVTDRVIGAEVLLRWNNPELGAVTPDRFIPVAEESGLILPIGQWLLFEACRQAALWQRDGQPFRIAVNISTRQFVGSSIVNAVEKALGNTGLDPTVLELELTEGLLLGEAPQTRRALERLKKLGVRLSLDDFGTGYSSLSYLRRYDFDTLKVDRSFIQDVETKPEATALVRAIIAMAHSLGMEVIGEGVETATQAEFLRQRGGHIAQGFYYSRPLPAEQFELWLKSYRADLSATRQQLRPVEPPNKLN